MSTKAATVAGNLLLLAAALLTAWGLLLVFNTSAAEIVDRAQDRPLHAIVAKQALFAFLGGVSALLSWRYGYEWLLRHPRLLWGATCLGLGICLIPGVGIAANGARRWISLAGMSAQPSEFAKLLLPLFGAAWCIQSPPNTWRSFVSMMARLILPVILVMAEPDNGTALLLLAQIGLLLLLSRTPLRFWVPPLCSLLLVAGAAAWQMPHVRHRLDAFLHPMQDILGKGHQAYQSAVAIGSGGLFGKGWGRGLQKLEYLPEAQNDYVAAIVGEETGLCGGLLLLSLYGVFVLSGYRIALRHPEPHRTLILSWSLLLGGQAGLNLAVVCGLLPSTGIPLPLLSQGGSSLLCNLIAVGWILHGARSRMASTSCTPHRQLYRQALPPLCHAP